MSFISYSEIKMELLMKAVESLYKKIKISGSKTAPLTADATERVLTYRNHLLGYYFIVEIIAALDKLGIWEKLYRPCHSSDLAREFSCHPTMLEALLDYLWINTPLIEKGG